MPLNDPSPSDPADASREDEDDDFEYEVEPPDQGVLRLAEERAKEDLTQAQRAIDVDAVYRQLDGRDDSDVSWDFNEFRFGIREMLIATGVVGLLLGAWRVGLRSPNAFAAFIAVSLVVLGTAHTYLSWRERRRREVLIARQEYERAVARGELTLDAEPAGPPPELGPAWDELKTSLRGFFTFGIRELLLVTVFAALLMVPVRVIGAAATAALVGLLALAGLAAQAADYDLPRFAIVLWWLLILAYCVLMLGLLIAKALGLAG